VEDKLNGVLDCYFFRVTDKHGGLPFAKDLEKLINSISNWDEYLMDRRIASGKPSFRLSLDSCSKSDFGNAKQVWVVWIRPVLNIIRDLALNCANRKHKIPDPWAPSAEKADAWVHVKFFPEYVEISLANSCSRNKKPDDIFVEVERNASTKTRWDNVYAFGGSIEPTKQIKGNPELFAVTVSLPYAPFMNSNREKRNDL